MIDVCAYQVIGELKENPHHLLMMGDDGHCYAYDLVSGEILPLEPDDSWAVDVTHPALLPIKASEDRLAS
jgi:hypothetical protein